MTQNGFLEIDSNRLTTQKVSRILIQTNSRLRNLSRILIPINSWLNDTIHSQVTFDHVLISYDLFGLSTKCWLVIWPFWAFDSSAFPRNWFESTHDSSSISETETELMTSGFAGIDSESIHDSSRFPGNDSARLMAQNVFPIFDSNQLMTQAKNIWYWVDSWFNSESYPCLLPAFSKLSNIPEWICQKMQHKLVMLVTFFPIKGSLEEIGVRKYDSVLPTGDVIWILLQK